MWHVMHGSVFRMDPIYRFYSLMPITLIYNNKVTIVLVYLQHKSWSASSLTVALGNSAKLINLKRETLQNSPKQCIRYSYFTRSNMPGVILIFYKCKSCPLMKTEQRCVNDCGCCVAPDDPWECSTCRRDSARAEPCAVLTCHLPLKWRQLGAVASHRFVDGANTADFSKLQRERKRDTQHTHTVWYLSWQWSWGVDYVVGPISLTSDMPARSARVQLWAVGGTGQGHHHLMWELWVWEVQPSPGLAQLSVTVVDKYTESHVETGLGGVCSSQSWVTGLIATVYFLISNGFDRNMKWHYVCIKASI